MNNFVYAVFRACAAPSGLEAFIHYPGRCPGLVCRALSGLGAVDIALSIDKYG